jgi:hypothetical protein
VEKIARAAADPELRDVASGALVILERVSKEGEALLAEPAAAKADSAAVLQDLKDTISRTLDIKVGGSGWVWWVDVTGGWVGGWVEETGGNGSMNYFSISFSSSTRQAHRCWLAVGSV